MNLRIRSIYVLLLSLFLLNQAQADPAENKVDLNSILMKLSNSVTPDQNKQIVEAIQLSPSLTSQLSDLAVSGKLTDIKVVSQAETTSPGKPRFFNVWTEGTSIIIRTNVMPELLKNRNYDVVHENDILPNNTTFVLGHMAYHLANPTGGMDLKKAVGNDYTAAAQEFVNKQLDREARAFIQSWNDVVNAAIKSNSGQLLSPQQVSVMMLNLRYRFVFVKALQQRENGIHISNSGSIEMNDANTSSIVSVLKTSAVVDIE